MPTGTLVRLPISMNRDDKVKTNLRGFRANNPFDYAQPKLNLTGLNLAQVSSAIPTGEGAWANTIKYAYEAQTEGNNTYISYTGPISVSDTFTIFIRFYIKDITGIAATSETLFFTGFTDPPQYIYNGYLINYARDRDLLSFDLLNGATVQLNTVALATNQWYHYGIKVRVVEGTVRVKAWENGVSIGPETDTGLGFPTPTGPSSLFSARQGIVDYFYGGITDFTFLEGNDITDIQMPTFASAPFI